MEDMNTMEDIFKKMEEKQAKFTKGFKRVAELLNTNPKLFAMNSAADVGKQIGVSETTVIRFCYTLGYEGYTKLQENVRKSLFNKSSLGEYLEAKVGVNEDNIFKHTMRNDIKNILELMNYICVEDLEKAVNVLSNSDRILVSGIRSSHAMASWFAHALDLVIGNTRLYHNDLDDILLRVGELSEQSTLVVFSFHRYSMETINIVKLAQQQDVFVIAFTDSRLSPITEFADLVLSVQLNIKSTLDVAPVVFILMNSIISSLSLQNSEGFKSRIKKFDAINTMNLFTDINN